MQSSQKQNALTKSPQEYGRLQKTIFILKYLPNPEYRKRVMGQLNKGEATSALRNFLVIADERHIRKRIHED